MAEALTRDFGPVSYEPGQVFTFPLGLPGFSDCQRFLVLKPRPEEALVVLQSMDRVEAAFLALPMELLAPGYRVRMLDQDRRVLATDAGAEAPAADAISGGDSPSWRVLAVLSLPETGAATVNLLGPVILNPATGRGVQAIRDDLRYGAAEPLEALLGARESGERKEAVCS